MKPLRVLLIVAALCSIVAAPIARQLIRLPFPGPAEPPFFTASVAAYVLHDGFFTVNDGQTAVIAFARPISIIPPNQDLLTPDFSLFGSPMTMRGFALFEEFPGPPTMSQARGNGAVPVWFMSQQELLTALADHVLTLAELEALPSLQKGVASFYQEQNHYAKHPVSHLAAVAMGQLEDGREFYFQAVEVALGLPTVTIRFY